MKLLVVLCALVAVVASNYAYDSGNNNYNQNVGFDQSGYFFNPFYIPRRSHHRRPHRRHHRDRDSSSDSSSSSSSSSSGSSEEHHHRRHYRFRYPTQPINQGPYGVQQDSTYGAQQDVPSYQPANDATGYGTANDSPTPYSG